MVHYSATRQPETVLKIVCIEYTVLVPSHCQHKALLLLECPFFMASAVHSDVQFGDYQYLTRGGCLSVVMEGAQDSLVEVMSSDCARRLISWFLQY